MLEDGTGPEETEHESAEPDLQPGDGEKGEEPADGLVLASGKGRGDELDVPDPRPMLVAYKIQDTSTPRLNSVADTETSSNVPDPHPSNRRQYPEDPHHAKFMSHSQAVSCKSPVKCILE